MTCRTNDGGTNYHVIPALRGTITVGSDFALTTLANLASVAINTSLVSDTDNTDDLGTAAKQWKDIYSTGTIFSDGLDMGGNSIILDTDDDTSINSSTDDNLNLNVGGSNRLLLTNTNCLLAVTLDMNSNDILIDADADSTIGDGGVDDTIQFATGGSARLSVTNTGITLTQPIDMEGNDINDGGVIFLNEQAAAEADIAGQGQVWVKTQTPNILMFTDDAGTDFEVSVSASGFLPLAGGTMTGNITMTNVSLDLNGGSSTIILDATNDRIGIGTTTPASNLEVLGNTTINNTLIIGEDEVVITLTT